MPTAYLVESLEEALKREGLHSLIPPDRRPDAFAPPAVLGAWVVLLACGSAIPVGLTRSWTLFGEASLANGAIILIVGFLLANSLFSGPVQVASGDHLEELEMLIVILSSVGVAAASALFSRQLSTFAIAMGWSAVVVLLIALARNRPYQTHTTLSAVRLALKMARKSLTLLAVLMPLSLVVVLFSFFSEEVWSTLGPMEPPKMAVVISLIFLPLIVLTLASTEREADIVLGGAKADLTGESITQMVDDHLKLSGLVGRSTPVDVQRAVRVLQSAGGLSSNERLQAVLRTRIKTVFILLLFFSSLALFIAMSGYLYILCGALFTPSMIKVLLEKAVAAGAPATSLADPREVLAKVAVILAAFVTSISSIQALTDNALDKFYQHWLREDVQRWWAVGALYRTLVAGEETVVVRQMPTAVVPNLPGT